MILTDAIRQFEDKFVRVRQPEKQNENKDISLICSGGTCKVGDLMPALFSSEDRAIDAWLKLAVSYITKDSTTLEWILKPEMLSFQMTMMDHKGLHRLVTNRYAIKSQFFVMGKEDG